MPGLMVTLGVLAIVLTVFAFTAHAAVPAVLTMTLWGVLAFMLVAPLQMRVMDQARAAPNMASILNQGAFNLGNATGAWIGGLVISAGFNYAVLPYAGAFVAVLALALAVLSFVIERGPPLEAGVRS